MTAVTAQTTQVYQVLIKASAQQVWDAITKPEFTTRYFHGSRVDTTAVPGTAYRSFAPDGQTLWIDETIYEADPPRRLVHGWRHLWDPRRPPSRRAG